MRNILSGLNALCFFALLAGCSNPTETSNTDGFQDPDLLAELPIPEFRKVDVRLVQMPLGERKYHTRLYATDTQVRPLSAHTAYEDAEGVVMVKQGYSPVALGQFGVMWSNGYRHAVATNRSEADIAEYLRRAVAHADRLWSLRQIEEWEGRELAYFAYEFSFDLHGIGSETMEPTWYSGMAQGYALTLFSWLYELTGDEEFLSRANATFHTMYRVDESGNLKGGKPSVPRTSYVDEAGYIWFDEYPHEMRTMVLNGFIFAIFGVHDYWQATGSPVAAELIQGASATLRRYGHRYIATNGGPSYYCLKHKVQSSGYHEGHINLLRGMYFITGDWAFEALAREFSDSYTAPT